MRWGGVRLKIEEGSTSMEVVSGGGGLSTKAGLTDHG